MAHQRSSETDIILGSQKSDENSRNAIINVIRRITEHAIVAAKLEAVNNAKVSGMMTELQYMPVGSVGL